MKIALIIEHFDAARGGRGGAEHVAVWLAQELVRRGHEVHVICHDVAARINRYRQATLRASHDAEQSHRAVPSAEPVPREGLHIHRLRGMRLNTALGFRVFGARAGQWVRRNRPDVAHSFSVACPGDIYHALAGVYAAMQEQAAHSRPTPARAAFKRLALRLPGKQRTLLAMERRMIRALGSHRGLRRIVSVCGMNTRELEALALEINGRRPGKSIIELPTPHLDLEAPEPSPEDRQMPESRMWFREHYGLSKEDRVALFVGNDFRRLGLRFAMEAVVRTQAKWKLLVVGMGKMREYVELAEDLGIGLENSGERRVLFVGPTRELSRVYAAADALLLPAFYEPAGVAARDALALGLPVISTQHLGVWELVRAHGAGRIVDSARDVASLAAALDGLPAAGSAEERALQQRARSAGGGPSPAEFLEALLKMYSQVRAEKQHGAPA